MTHERNLCCVWSDVTYTGHCHRGTRRQNDRLSWLWTQSTALYPSIYLPQRLAGSTDAALMVRYRRCFLPQMTSVLKTYPLWSRRSSCWTFLSSLLRYRLLEALRVASLWRNGDRANHATPVLAYARLAFTHTLNFLNKVAAHKLVNPSTVRCPNMWQTCVYVQTDLEHTLGESASLGAAGVVLWGQLKFAKSKVVGTDQPEH